MLVCDCCAEPGQQHAKEIQPATLERQRGDASGGYVVADVQIQAKQLLQHYCAQIPAEGGAHYWDGGGDAPGGGGCGGGGGRSQRTRDDGDCDGGQESPRGDL